MAELRCELSWIAELVLLATTLFDSPVGIFPSYQIGIFFGGKKMVLLAKVEIGAVGKGGDFIVYTVSKLNLVKF